MIFAGIFLRDVETINWKVVPEFSAWLPVISRFSWEDKGTQKRKF